MGCEVGSNAFYFDLSIWDSLGMAWRRERLNTQAMRFRGADPEGAEHQRWLLALWHLCNLPELLFAYSALGCRGSDRLSVNGLWDQFHLTWFQSLFDPAACCKQHQIESERLQYFGDPILHLSSAALVWFSTCSPLSSSSSSLFLKKLRKHVWQKTSV